MTCTAATNSAPKSRYSPASAAITAISESALLMGCVWASRLTAPATQTAPKARNRIRCMLSIEFRFRLPGDRDRGGNEIHQRQRQQEFPAKRHQLVVTEARQRAPHPDIQKEKYKNLRSEPEHRQHGQEQPRCPMRLQPRLFAKRAMPSAKKQKCCQA